MNNSPSNIFQVLLLLERYFQNCQIVLATTGVNGLMMNCNNLLMPTFVHLQTISL